MIDERAELSLIIPCFNSFFHLQKELPGLIEVLQKENISYEILLVDDGSSSNHAQNTQQLALECGCAFFRLPANTGKGAALRKGFSEAKGKVCIFTDSDIPFEYNTVIEAMRILLSGRADLVIGDRTHPQSVYYQKVGFIRHIGSVVISFIGTRILKNNIADTQCGLKGFTRKAAGLLFPATITSRFGIDFELLFIASKLDLVIKKIPVKLRTAYPSSVRVLRDGLKTLAEIFSAISHHGRQRNAERR